MNHDNKLEKIGLLALAVACIVTLAIISFKALGEEAVDPNAATLLGAIVAGLIATAGNVIQAIRGYSMGAQLSKVTDQLAASAPTAPLPEEAPAKVEVINSPDNPVNVEEKK